VSIIAQIPDDGAGGAVCEKAGSDTAKSNAMLLINLKIFIVVVNLIFYYILN
jgi:hypothetical protein